MSKRTSYKCLLTPQVLVRESIRLVDIFSPLKSPRRIYREGVKLGDLVPLSGFEDVMILYHDDVTWSDRKDHLDMSLDDYSEKYLLPVAKQINKGISEVCAGIDSPYLVTARPPTEDGASIANWQGLCLRYRINEYESSVSILYGITIKKA